MSSESSKVFKGIGKQTIVVILLGIIDLTYFSIMSRLLTKEEFGLYAIIMSVTYVIMEISNGSFGVAVVQKKDANKDFISTAFSLSLISSIIFTVLVLILANSFSLLLTKTTTLTMYFQIMSISVFCSVMNSFGRATLIKKLDFWEAGVISIVASFISCIVGVIMAIYDYGLYAVLMAINLNYLIMLLIFLYKKHFNYSIIIKKDCVKEILSYGGWTTASGIIRSIYEQLDKLITARWIPTNLLGAYNRPAGFLTTIFNQVNSIFDTILFPIVSEIQDDKEKVESSFCKSISLIVVFSLICSYTFILASEIIIRIFFGVAWLDLIPITRIISFSIIFMSFSRICDCFFRSLGKVRTYFNVRLFVCILSVFVIFWGCQYSILGLSLALLTTRFLDSFVKSIVFRNIIKISYSNLIRNVCLSSILPTILFLLCYAIEYYISGLIGSIMGVMSFVTSLVIIVMLHPHMLGDAFYENIYVKYLIKLKL